MGKTGPLQWPEDPDCGEVRAPMNINEDEGNALELLQPLAHLINTKA